MHKVSFLLLSFALAFAPQGKKQPFTIEIASEKPVVPAGSDVVITVCLANSSHQALDESVCQHWLLEMRCYFMELQAIELLRTLDGQRFDEAPVPIVLEELSGPGIRCEKLSRRPLRFP